MPSRIEFNPQTLLLFTVALFGLFAWWNRKSGASQFGTRESERNRSQSNEKTKRQEERKAPLLLPGFNPGASHHEVLGVAADASPKKINAAYRELMKRYHPDLFSGRPLEEQAAVKRFAQQIIAAKEALLKKAKK
jgi:DnaJ-domain-containing protein 1